MEMLYDAGFQSVTKVPTDGQPGIFATLDAGAPKTVAVYFMYDVKQVTPPSGRRRRGMRPSSTSRDSAKWWWAAVRSIRRGRRPPSWPRSTRFAARVASFP